MFDIVATLLSVVGLWSLLFLTWPLDDGASEFGTSMAIAPYNSCC